MAVIGPLAIKTNSDNYIWIKILTDEHANLLTYSVAIDFAQNQWAENLPITQLQEKLSAYDPLESSVYCLIIKKVEDHYNAVRFKFRTLNASMLPLPDGEIYTASNYWRHDYTEKSRGVVVATDYWQHNNVLDAEYIAWNKVVHPKWHQGEDCDALVLVKTDQEPINSCLTTYQKAQINNTIFYDWESLKEESQNAYEYCQALALIMTGELSTDLMQEMQFSEDTQANALAVRFYLLSTTLDKLGNTFYAEEEGRSSTIADVHHYLIALMQQEINQYYPKMQVNVTTIIPASKVGMLEEYIHYVRIIPAKICRILNGEYLADKERVFEFCDMFLQTKLSLEAQDILNKVFELYKQLKPGIYIDDVLIEIRSKKLEQMIKLDPTSCRIRSLINLLSIDCLPEHVQILLVKTIFNNGWDKEVNFIQEDRIKWNMYFINNCFFNKSQLKDYFLIKLRPMYLKLINEENQHQICEELINKTMVNLQKFGLSNEYIALRNDIFKFMGNNLDLRLKYLVKQGDLLEDSLTFLQLIYNQDINLVMQVLLPYKLNIKNFKNIFPNHIKYDLDYIFSTSYSKWIVSGNFLYQNGGIISCNVHAKFMTEYLYNAIPKLNLLKMQILQHKAIIEENGILFNELFDLINKNRCAVARASLMFCRQISLIEELDCLLKGSSALENPMTYMHCQEKLDALVDVILDLFTSEKTYEENLLTAMHNRESELYRVLTTKQLEWDKDTVHHILKTKEEAILEFDFNIQMQKIVALIDLIKTKYLNIQQEIVLVELLPELMQLHQTLNNIRVLAQKISPFERDYQDQCKLFKSTYMSNRDILLNIETAIAYQSESLGFYFTENGQDQDPQLLYDCLSLIYELCDCTRKSTNSVHMELIDQERHYFFK